MEELTQALSRLGDPLYWAAVLAAVFVAAFTGIIPGASGILIMALSIPFIVLNIDDPGIGLVMLASMTGVNNTLDSIPAVLLGQPGAATQVTFLEGHQLARQGKAAHTLGAIYGVSALGGIIGAITLAALIPVIKPFILQFGFPEIAAMALFGIAMVSALSAGAMVKGLTAGMLGILFGTVGINPVTGDVRFVFQQPILGAGLPLIATTLGLFALPEMFDLTMTRKAVASSGAVISTAEVWRGTKHGLSTWKVVIRQSIFGVLMGAIPGVGAAVIDWLAYAFGIFFTKDKSQFGKGSLDGVLFAESAQNSKEAGQAIPTLALGVPGGLAWALVLVAMFAYNVPPGPPLLGDRADITILLVITLAIANLMVTAMGILATGQLAKLTLIPYPMIGAVIIPTALLTGFLNMTSWIALPIMLVFMGIGLIMKAYQWPRPPLLLGVILGTIIEFNLQSAVNIHGAVGVATRPLTIALVLIAIGTAYAFIRFGKAQKTQLAPRPSIAAQPPIAGGAPDADEAVAEVDADEYVHLTLWQALWQGRNFPILIAVGGAAAFMISSLDFRAASAYLPRFMAGGVMLLALIQLATHLRQRTVRRVDIMDLGMRSTGMPGAKQAAYVLGGALFLFMLLAGILGLRWGALAFAGIVPLALMEGRLRHSVAPVGAALIVWALIWTGDNAIWRGLFAELRADYRGELVRGEYFLEWWAGLPFLLLLPVLWQWKPDRRSAGILLGGGAVAWAVVWVLVATGSIHAQWAWITLPYFALLPTMFTLKVWRWTGAVMAVTLVAFFEATMMDRLMFVIWPEAAYWNFITTRIF